MASSGSFSGSIRDGHYKLRVDWSQSKNVSANTSTITCKLYLVNDWSLSISGRSDNTWIGADVFLPGDQQYGNTSSGNGIEDGEPRQ